MLNCNNKLLNYCCLETDVLQLELFDFSDRFVMQNKKVLTIDYTHFGLFIHGIQVCYKLCFLTNEKQVVK